jgi:hypothetical protein
VFPSSIIGAFTNFAFLPTLPSSFSFYSLLTSSGHPPSSVSKSLLAALKDKGKHPTMLLSGESGNNKKIIYYYIALLEWTTIF